MIDSNSIEKYANLLLDYCLQVNTGEQVYISSTMLAEPLLRRLYEGCIIRGAHPQIHMELEEQAQMYYTHADEAQLQYLSPIRQHIFEHFDAYLYIRAPYNLAAGNTIDANKRRLRQKALAPINQLYSRRTAEGSMKRSLCQYPTRASAQMAEMSLSDYADFVFSACQLDQDKPLEAWKEIGAQQQAIVDYLNQVRHIQYQNANTDISFSVSGRTWINSDGRTNMPSGEVYTSPVEDSVNGHIRFDYPAIYQGKRLEGISLEVKDGKVIKATASQGQSALNEILQQDGASQFGEVAIGTNYNIQRATGNILFDEKMGGTVHMALGQSYLQTGGKNQSPIHLDLIADMKDNARIVADGQTIYENGQFTL